MTSLVPTPRTDKNGRTQIRHVRTDAVTPVQRGSIPSPAASANNAAPREGSDEHVLTLIGCEDALTRKHWVEWEILRLLREDDGTLLPLATELMTTGSPEAQAAARSTMRVLVDAIKDAIDESDEPDDDHRWRDLVRYAWGPLGANRLTCSWATGSVYGEVGRAVAADRYSWDPEVRDLLQREEMLFGTGHTPKAGRQWASHWRGVAALHMIDEARFSGGSIVTAGTDPQGSDLQRFVDWAGNHEDIALVIEVATERSTLHVEMLEPIATAMKTDSTALREGVL